MPYFDTIITDYDTIAPHRVQTKPPPIGGLTYNANCMGVE